ncbi:hypothetical protein ACWFPQ_11590 [Peribacillus butanolivorans]
MDLVKVTATGMTVLAVKIINTITNNCHVPTIFGIVAVFLSLLVLYRPIKTSVLSYPADCSGYGWTYRVHL